ERAAKLVQQGVIPHAEWDTVDSEFRVATSRYQDALEEIRNRQGLLEQRRSEVALAKQQLADTVVSSPLEGVVQENKTSVGEYLDAGYAVVVIVSIDTLRIRVVVYERESVDIQ